MINVNDDYLYKTIEKFTVLRNTVNDENKLDSVFPLAFPSSVPFHRLDL